MGFNLELARQRRENLRHQMQDKKFGGGNSQRESWPYLHPSRLQPDTRFILRFLPPWPERCPAEGFHCATHAVQVQPNAPPVRFWCLLEDEKDCYLCDFLEAVQEQWVSFPDHVKRAIRGSLGSPGVVVRKQTIFPIVIRATQVQDPAGEPGKMLWVPKQDVEVGVLLILDDYSGLLESIESLFFDEEGNDIYDEVVDIEHGRYVFLEKKLRKYELRLSPKPSPLKSKELYSDAKYPRVASLFRSKKIVKSYEEQEATLKAAWWAKDLFREDSLAVGADEVPF